MSHSVNGPAVLVIGGIEAARLLCAGLTDSGARVVHLVEPTSSEIRQVCEREDLSGAAILTHSDVHALRYALLLEQLEPGVRLVVTIFRRTMAQELSALLPNCTVTSPADLAAPSVAARALGADLLAVDPVAGRVLTATPEGPTLAASQGMHGTTRRLSRWLRPTGYGGRERLAASGFAGLLAILLLDWGLTRLAFHEGPWQALYAATRVVTTVGPAHEADSHMPLWYLVVATFLMLAAVGFTGAFVAGLVDWLVTPRTASMLGSLQVPRRGHVVIVGLGQVGLRTSLLLRQLGIESVIIERSADAANLPLAKGYGIPVVVGDAQSKEVLNRAGLGGARAVAALASSDIDNIGVAIIARANAPHVPVVLRAGEDPAIAESTSLLPLGRVVDISELTACWVSAALDGHAPQLVAAGPDREANIVVTADGVRTRQLPPSCNCSA
jgi:hypothetical protein